MTSNGRVLVVDDELGARMSMQMILRNQFDVSMADNGERAIELIRQKDFDVVVLDIKMAGLSGIDVLKRIKEVSPSPEVMMVTAYASLDTAKNAIKLGAYDYIEKPFDTFDELREAVNKGIERKARASQAIQLSRELNEIQEQIVHVEKLASIGLMTSEVIHELSTPLTGVLGYSELLLTMDCDESTKNNLVKINHEAMRCYEIIRNLLAFARKSETEKKPININDVIRKVIDVRKFQLRMDNIEVAMELDRDLPEVMGNFNQIQQVVINIVNNADHAMRMQDGKRQLRITTKFDLENVRISIANNGPAIPSDMLETIFEPFFTTKKSGSGTGLGLSVSRKIIKEHCGKISVKSNEDKGVEFILEIPVLTESII